MREHPADRSWASRPVSLSRLPSAVAERHCGAVGAGARAGRGATRPAVTIPSKPGIHGALELGYERSFCLA